MGTNAVPALRGVDLDVKPAEFLALMGPSGCGKTTLLNLIGGLDQPTRGHIFLDGRDMATLNENQLADLRRDKIGYVFQFYNLLPLLSAIENVMIPMHFKGNLSKRARHQKAMELLKLVHLDERVDHTPSELSGENSNVLQLHEHLQMIPRLCCWMNQQVIWIVRLELKF